MKVLVLNCGSSSVKADVLDSETGERLDSKRAERLAPGGHEGAVREALQAFAAHRIEAVGHRVVHGGAEFSEAARIDEAVEAAIEAACKLAPLHNPANLAGIRAARAALPEATHVAVFDTAFHATLPRRARHYALPAKLAEKHGLRRYGFHGTSHEWVARKAAKWLGQDLMDLKIITCHLGNGASVCAVEYGRSVETSMGMTPLEGLVMGTRSGDVDAGLILDLMRREGMNATAMETLLNKQGGLVGLSGVSNDMRDIEARAEEGDEACRLALQVFAHRLRKYIGAYAAVMGGVDAIVFTAGIGENSASVRHRVAQRLGYLGARLDPDRNRDAKVSAADPVFEISEPRARTKLLVVKTDEALHIAQQAAALAHHEDEVERALTIPIAISARHIHLTQEAVEALFGPGHQLTPYKPLSQPGQFACEERLTLIGPKRNIERVRVLGPTRGKCQVEISRTDEFHLGLDAPVRRSGDVGNSPGITLEAPDGTRLTLSEGIICAWRHIHMTPVDAQRFGVKHRDVVEVEVDTEGRDLIFGDVMVRVSEKYVTEMHLDTDEANAAEITGKIEGALVDTGRAARLRKKHVHV